MVPISTYEDPEWMKNVYSDLNFVTICDKGDNREFCDINTERTYDYQELPKKSFDIFNRICGYERQYKVIVKMDFDVFIGKSYLYEVFSFMVENHSMRIYFGDPMGQTTESKGTAMNGKIYAVTSNIISDYCSCNTPEPGKRLEDMWFGQTVVECVKKKGYKPEEQIIYYHSKENLIYHKRYKKNNVDLQAGRKIEKKNKNN
ncbi:hypothetical protein AYI70_g10639 [Smittium culicis]|uniref:Hexosyltransferase n=1 Tax=Smittium culicis TaxID=133412 RepID=A0A1R1X5M0_9FUNG|nr:hypothetical protein AYI70_g10639 [Smittium culicis]